MSNRVLKISNPFTVIPQMQGAWLDCDGDVGTILAGKDAFGAFWKAISPLERITAPHPGRPKLSFGAVPVYYDSELPADQMVLQA